ncbi:MAG: hypothetical protein CMQ00_08335 [Gammaproteobacteria bacterium]|nr:hypothetical protein [Gammaproteobacteria bacterium]OUV74586.1 MAG: hypothetical protein CBC99_06785 [Gammaproteobacteria bacterium TMED139]
MLTSILGPYTRTILTGVIIWITIVFCFTLMSNAYVGIFPFFEWMETTWFGVIGKTWGAAFAFVQTIHLLSLALLGGAVLAAEGRILGLLLTDVSAQIVIERCHVLLVWALVLLISTGVFMACGVALKVYYLPVFWYKMLALGTGILFHFYIRKPLFRFDLQQINPIVVKMTAIASILVWFMVAATGRWIGFSG